MEPNSAIWKGRVTATESIVLVVTFALTFALMRGLAMLGPTRLRWLLPLGFVLMALTPWLLFNSEGRKKIGLIQPITGKYLVCGVVGGILSALACFLIGRLLFQVTPNNWFVTIANNYRTVFDTTGFTTTQLHLVFTIPAVLFSPIGEEIFFRGVLQNTLEQRLSAKASTHIECAAFGLVHLCHHGLISGPLGITMLPVSGILWMSLMFAVGWMFAWLRASSKSLLPAITAHVFFNITMNVMIFSFLWDSL